MTRATCSNCAWFLRTEEQNIYANAPPGYCVYDPPGVAGGDGDISAGALWRDIWKPDKFFCRMHPAIDVQRTDQENRIVLREDLA